MSITTITTRITVDMAGGDVKRYAVKAKQYDRATRVVAVSLLWDGAPYNVGDNSVRCNVHKPDGTIAIIDGGNVNVEDNTVYVSLIGAALTAAGRAWADIEIETQDESQQISCQCFEIDIARSPVDDDSIISTNEFSAMKAATKAANDAAAAALAEIDVTAAAGAAANQAAAAAQAATDAANQAAAAATASIQIDTTLTDNSKAAPAGMVGEIKEDLSAVEEDNSTEIPFKQNVIKGMYIRAADGKSASSTKYARTSLIDVGDSKRISISNATYQMCVAYYDNTGTVSTGAGYIDNSGYVDGGNDVAFPNNAVRFGVSFRRADQSELTDSDITAISDAIKIKTIKANAALNAVDGLATEYTVVNKDSGVVIDYYIGISNGEIKSSSLTVKVLCLPCRPCETYRIRHPKSTQFVVASYVTQPRLSLTAQKVYNGRYETVTVFTTDEFASWLGIYYYSSANSNPLTMEETYDALKIEVVDNIALSAKPSCYTVNNAIALPTTYEEIFALYDGLVASRPDYVTKNTLTSGNLTNYEYVFSTGNYNKYAEAKRNPDPEITKPTILLTSGVHGYERSAVVSLYLLMRDLCDNNYALTDLLNYVNIRVIPVGCPWGYTHNSRLNANGVNINRNFATSTWGDYEPGEPGSADYAGPSAGSEDETKIIQNWMQAHSDALFYIDFHNSNFSQEVVEIGGPDTDECTLFKKRFLLAMNRVIPHWQKDRNMDSDNSMYCYTGGYDTIQGRTSRYYAYEVGIHKPFTCETSWNINGTGKHSIETFLVGAEAMGNFLVGMKKYYEEI